MRILINSLNYHPELTGIGKYTGEMAEWLVKNGHEVRVVTAPPYYPEWFVSPEYSAYRYKNETINGVKVWRCPVYVPSKLSGLKRIIHLASFTISSLPVLLISQLFWRPKVIITIEPPLFSAPFVWLSSRLFRGKCWLHIQDYEVDAAFDLGILSSQRLRYLIISIEKWLLKRFDAVSTISKPMMERLVKKGVLSERQFFFPNWVNTNEIFPIKEPSSFRKQFGISGETVVALYSGNMGEKQGLEIIIEAALSLKNSNKILFVMCGAGAALSDMHKSAAGLKNILWLPLQPIERLNDLLNLADIHLLPQRERAAELVMPSKLTGMLATGKPILSTVNEGSQISTVLENSGIISPPGDFSSFLHELVDLADNKKLREQLGKNARQYAINHLGIDAILDQFNQDLHGLILKTK